jgi:hypothetical protein
MTQPYWNQPLSASYNWGSAGFQNLTDHAKQQQAAYAQAYPNSLFRVASIVATYSTSAQKQNYVNGAVPQDQAQYASGAVVGAATRFYPAGNGEIGMITSPLQNAAQSSSTGANDWHTVEVMRQQGTMWIHDPAYVMNS